MSRRRHRLVVASDQSLVAEAVRMTLLSRGFDTTVVPWFASRAARPVRAGHPVPEVALMMCDLEPAPRLREAQALVERVGAPWLLLTAAPQGPLWGAMLESGVELVLPNSTPQQKVVEILAELIEGRAEMADPAKQRLVREWREARAEKEQLVERIRSLTPRERTVLRLLFAGDGVKTIAGLLGVSEATVRSHVKSVLRKLDVSSQLAAVAAYGWLQEHREVGVGGGAR